MPKQLNILFAGIILALVLKTGYKDVETAAEYHKKERYFQQTMHTHTSLVPRCMNTTFLK
jgi:hypothetical protein